MSSSRVETRSHRAHIGQLTVIALLALQLGACVTTSSVPNSPFLTAVVRLNPLAPASTTNADAVNDAPKAKPTASGIAARGGTATSHIESADVETTAAVVPAAERKEVYPQLASASSSLATIAAPSAPQTAMPRSADAASPKERGILLGEAVGAAVLSHPLIGAQAARVSGSLADVRTAEGSLKPQLQVYAGSGGSYLGSYVNYPRQFSDVAVPGSSRSDAGFTLRQLIYDFGAAKADIARSKSLVDAERLRLADQAEDIALRTANAYFNLLEQGELIAQIDRVVADDNNFAKLVMLNEKQGNGTVADVNRIKSKVIEVEALRTDIVTALRTAEDEFFRLTKLDPTQVRRSPPPLPRIPSSYEPALEAAKRLNPSLLAFGATGSSIDHQLASQKAQQLPRVDLQGDGLVKHYIGNQAASQGIVDSRLMVMVSYKLFDGGIMASQVDRIREDKKANDFRTLDEKESIELNLRRLYQSLSANRTKETSAIQGIATAQKANTLYLEQFKAGKRTVFEVLDSRMVVFTMQKNSINGKYEQLRAAYGILRNVGTLVESAVRSSAGS